MSKKKLTGIVAALILTIIVVAAAVAPAPDSEEVDSPVARAEFVFSNLIVSPAEVEPGDTVTVTVEVQNVGGEEGTYLLELAVDGLVEQSEGVTLDAGEATSMSFAIQKETVSPYSVELEGLVGAFLVVEPASTPPNAAEPTHITLGAHKDDVVRIQGEPDGVDTIGSLEMWYYDDGTVYFDRKTGIVTGWYNNTGYLKARVSVGEKNVTSATYITLGSHKDDVYRIQGEPDGVDTIGSLKMWYYDHDTVYLDRKTHIVTGWNNNTGYLKARVSVGEKNVTSATYITLGSHKDDVYRIQGEPDGVDTIGSLKMWYYDHDTVYLDRKTHIVTGWYNNTGYLKARVSVGEKNVTSATYITLGSHKDDVYRIQGEPDGVDTIGSLETWYYCDGHIYFDGRTSRVTGWQNTTGHLKVTPA